MKKSRELKGMPVLTLQEGERLGQVRELILDPATRQVVALVLDQRTSGKEEQVVATANVRNVGTTAITVEDRSSLVPLNRIPRFQELARARKPVQGKMVMSESGTRLGQVDDMEVDVETFQIVSLVLKGLLGRRRVISADRVRTIGADAIVVRDEPTGTDTPPVADAAPPPEIVSPPPLPVEPAPEEAACSLELPSEPVPPPAEATPSPPAAAESPLADALPDRGEDSPAEEAAEGENAWQRWVRRLKSGQ